MPEASHQLAAIMFTDIVGYTSMMGKDEQKAIRLLDKNLSIQKPLIEQHQGKLLKEMGDGLLSSFNSVIEAVKCAIEIQDKLKDDSELNIRVGIHTGDVLFRDGDVFGDGVNIASRIEAIAEEGEIVVSEAVYQNIKNQEGISTEFIKEKYLKNVEESIKIYRVSDKKSTAFISKKTEKTNENQKSIVVLPFVNISNDPEQEYFSDGLTEEIITDLSQLQDLLVISRSSSMTFKGSNKKIQQIAQELNVQHVLEGSVRKAGNKFRITAQLIHAETDSHLWAEKFSGTLDDIFDIQERVSRSIVEALKLKLSQDGSQQISEKPIKDPRAYDLYKKAQYEFYLFKEEGQKRAINYLKAAIDIERQNAFLWAKLGLTYLNLFGIIGEANAKLMDEAELCAQKVSELDPEGYLYHSIKGLIAIFKAQGKAMVRHMKKSHDLNPNDTETLVFLSLGYFYLGKPQECFKVLNKLQEVDPFNTVDLTILGISYYMNGEIDKALESSRAGYLKNPDVPQAKLYYAYFLACHGKKNEALIILDKFITNTSGSISSVVGEFFKASLTTQETNLKYSMSDETKNKLRIDIEWSWLVADFYALSGNLDESIDWLNYIVDHGFINYPLLSKHDKLLENVRQDKRYIELMTRVKTEWENFSFTE